MIIRVSGDEVPSPNYRQSARGSMLLKAQVDLTPAELREALREWLQQYYEKTVPQLCIEGDWRIRIDYDNGAIHALVIMMEPKK